MRCVVDQKLDSLDTLWIGVVRGSCAMPGVCFPPFGLLFSMSCPKLGVQSVLRFRPHPFRITRASQGSTGTNVQSHSESHLRRNLELRANHEF